MRNTAFSPFLRRRWASWRRNLPTFAGVAGRLASSQLFSSFLLDSFARAKAVVDLLLIQKLLAAVLVKIQAICLPIGAVFTSHVDPFHPRSSPAT